MNQEISLEEYKEALRVVWKKLMRDSIIIMMLVTLVLTLIGLGYIYLFPIDFLLSLFMHILVIWIVILILTYFVGTNKVDIIINEIENGTYMSNLDEFKHAFRKALKQRYMRIIKIYLLISILILGILMHVFQMDLIMVGILFICFFGFPFAAWDEIIEEIEEKTMKELSKQ